MTSQLRQLIKDFLGSLSEGLFLLQTVKSLEIKVRCLEVEKFDAVLLDLSVSDSLGGSEDLAVLKARWPTVPIVVPRDIKDENTALSVLGWGAQDCLVKRRFHRELLVRAIHYAIEQSQLYRQLAIANQKLQQLATTDGLTGLANRRQFDRIFRLEWRRLAREELPLSLIVFDIDFFKLYNEFYGHVGGDDCWRWRCRGDRHSCQAGWGFDRPLRRRRICRSAAQH